MYLIDFLIGQRNISINMLMPDLYNYWWHIKSFESIIVKKETHMFYVSSVIAFNLVSELLWKFTLLVRYKLNIFRPPQVNQFDNSALLFGGYTSFIPLDKMVVYGYWKTLPSGSSSMLHIALTVY